MGSIRLHPERGVNPRMTYCRRCGGAGNDIMLIGANEGVYRCRVCNLDTIGGSRCAKCGELGERVRTLTEHEKVPSSDLCGTCRKETEEHSAIVADGGIYFKCSACPATGVLRADSDLAKAVRKQEGIEPPALTGVCFNAETCPVCNPDLVQEP